MICLVEHVWRITGYTTKMLMKSGCAIFPCSWAAAAAVCGCTDHGRAGSEFPWLHPRLHRAGEGTGRGGITADPIGHSGWEFQCCQRNTAAFSALPGSMCLWEPDKATWGLGEEGDGHRDEFKTLCYFPPAQIFKANEVAKLPLTVCLLS